MNILFLGDIVAKTGRNAVLEQLPLLQEKYSIDFTIVNAENAAHGKGITTKIYRSLKECGVDAVTLGNHAFSKREILDKLGDCPDMIRPANILPEGIGSSFRVFDVYGKRVAVCNILGKVFMDVATIDPYAAMDEMLKQIDADIIFVDLHAEATGEKETFFHHFKDKLTAVVGTHTHVQTADEQISNGCAYITDAGMCGSFDSILGRNTEEVIHRSVYGEQTRYTPSETPAVVSGVVITVNDHSNRAESIIRIQHRPEKY